MIKKWEDTDLWYKKDDKFNMPKAIINMKLYTSDCGFGTTLNGRVFSTFWMNLASECMREFNASCVSANVDFSSF